MLMGICLPFSFEGKTDVLTLMTAEQVKGEQTSRILSLPARTRDNLPVPHATYHALVPTTFAPTIVIWSSPVTKPNTRLHNLKKYVTLRRTYQIHAERFVAWFSKH